MKPNERLEQLHADHELFLQAFEKPTQIYRYLRTRNLISPIFLYRTLTFMKSRSSRNNSSRQNFKVDSLLDKKIRESLDADQAQSLNEFMNLTFLGFYDKRRERPLERVGVELVLLKMAHKKRKESSCPVVQVSLGTAEVPVNPSEDHPPSKAPAISVSSKSFSSSEGHQPNSYTLVIRVYNYPLPQVNGVSSNGEENLEPAAKKRKILRGSMDDGRVLSSELVVYDKHSRCLLTEGEYELVLSDSTNNEKISPKKNNSPWETIHLDRSDKTIADQFDVFGCCPTLKFRLSWSSEPAGSMVERPRPLMPRDNCDEVGGSCSNRSSSRSSRNNAKQNQQTSSAAGATNGVKKLREKAPCIVYQFLYNNNTRQQTEAREDLHCPWCALNCMELYALLKHLKLSHPRFLFTYVPIEEGARIDVSVSELYDSTYVGNPHDLISQPPGYAFSRYGPVQRTSITNILVCKPKRTAKSLSEFLEIDGDNDLSGPYDGQRPFVTGHNRLYHYSTTCLPMPPYAILQPSTEDVVDPPWLMTKICRMIDEFSDVNEGEKDFMKMWNLHVQHYTYLGDCQMNLALKTFIAEQGKEIIAKKLYRNFVLHCCNLFEFGVISPVSAFAAITKMQQFMKEQEQPLLDGLTRSWKSQRETWLIQNPSLVTCKEVKVSLKRKDFSGLFKNENSVIIIKSESSQEENNPNQGKSNSKVMTSKDEVKNEKESKMD